MKLLVKREFRAKMTIFRTKTLFICSEHEHDMLKTSPFIVNWNIFYTRMKLKKTISKV